jgi:hypothetical protein
MKEPNVDKRSKEYREYKAWLKNFNEEQSKKPDGLGDVVKSITKATGIDKLVKFIAGEDCGCDERQKLLNKEFHFSKPNCLDELEYNWLSKFYKERKYNITFEQRERLYVIYNRVFSTTLKNSTCSSCLRGVINKLETIIKTY